MKISVEISEKNLQDIMRFSGEKKKGPAIAKFLVSELMLRRRREMCDEVMSGQWSIELPNWEARRSAERTKEENLWEC